ncbi:hypothetical protein NECAME_08138 [Necator americanus]|uniref:Uncharacterized protein n=1 Tax=Necator americanus TaxID=51031 RepID=W2TM88_NECAM|nr:hypothetical protein NECAME_08138 [Necator americanus]ETN82147.1 hypothetical protein NECAME_08138 [Necator americanus]
MKKAKKDIIPSDAKMDEFSVSNSIATNGRARSKRQYQYYNPGYYNPLGTGSAWAAGGGVIGNTLSFLVG